jgi:hypothetical protein
MVYAFSGNQAARFVFQISPPAPKNGAFAGLDSENAGGAQYLF